jgi:hypothetical protein
MSSRTSHVRLPPDLSSFRLQDAFQARFDPGPSDGYFLASAALGSPFFESALASAGTTSHLP